MNYVKTNVCKVNYVMTYVCRVNYVKTFNCLKMECITAEISNFVCLLHLP